MKRKITKRVMVELHESICKVYGLPVIPIVWTSTRRGRFAYEPLAIRLGIKCWRGIKTSFIHEFAHYLTYAKHGPGVKHGKKFYYNLIEIAGYVLGNPKNYKWYTEYKSLRKRWIQDTQGDRK